MTKVRLRRSLRAKLLLTTVLVEAVMLFLLVANSVRLTTTHLVKQTDARLAEMQASYNVALAGPLAARDYASLQNILDGWRKVEGVDYLVVVSPSGKTLASSGWEEGRTLPEPEKVLSDERPVFHAAFPITYLEQTYGSLHFGLKTEFLRSAKRDLLTQSAIIAAAEMLLSAMLLLAIGFWLTRHLRMLAQASMDVAEGNYAIRLGVPTEDEVGVLAQNFDRMAIAVQNRMAALVESEQRSRAIADYTYAWESWFGPGGDLRWVNPAVERVTGYTVGECRRMRDFPLPLIFSEDRSLVARRHGDALAGRIGQDEQFRVQCKDGKVIWVAMSWQPIYDEQGSSLGYRSSIRDITVQHHATEELAFQATHDPLTGLYNRRAFEAQLARMLATDEAQRGEIAVLYIDLDQFKLVNDTCGHAAGDVLLQRLARMMEEKLSYGFLARLGGDEFGLLLVGSGAEDAVRRAQHLIDEVRGQPFSWDNHSFRLGASVGIAVAQPGLESVTDLLIAADTACYAAKEQGRSRVQLFTLDDEFLLRQRREFLSVSAITEALEEDRFVLYFQQIKALRAGQSDHAEILVRLRARDGRIVLPALFIPAAERYGMMGYVDRWVIEAVCRVMQQCRERNIALPWDQIAVNLSGATLSDDKLPGFIAEKLAYYGVEPAQLCFEVTETAAFNHFERAVGFLTQLRQLGCALSLDDFGTGLSSFAYLKRIPVHYLKIDGLFVKGLDHDATDLAVVESAVHVARVHGIATVAEYVCNPEVLRRVQAAGVDYAQGYALHEPEPLAPFLGLAAVAQTS